MTKNVHKLENAQIKYFHKFKRRRNFRKFLSFSISCTRCSSNCLFMFMYRCMQLYWCNMCMDIVYQLKCRQMCLCVYMSRLSCCMSMHTTSLAYITTLLLFSLCDFLKKLWWKDTEVAKRLKHISGIIRVHFRIIKSMFTWDPKWTQIGLRFLFGVMFRFGSK